MTICLIIPPSVFLQDERVFTCLGILRVAACLERDGHTVEMIDCSGVKEYEQAISDHASHTEATLFGITSTTPQMPQVVKIVKSIRASRPDAKVMLGGPHITLINAALKREKKLGINGRATRAFSEMEGMFDILVAGDGEDAVFLALGENPPKLIDADIPSSSLFLTNERMNELPWPARHLVDLSSYHYTIDGLPATSALFQTGCPFACSFCGGRESPMLRRIRMRTTENIIGEIRHIYSTYGIRAINAYDDELNVNTQMVELMNAMAQLQKELGVEIRFRGFIKSQLFTDQQAEAMYRAGFRWILVGFESGNERILENINKKATRSENTRCMGIAKRHGLKVKALMSIGHAGESEETIADTRDWLLEVKPDDFDVTVITKYPGTPYWDQALPNQSLGGNVFTYTAPKSKDRLHSYDVSFTESALYYKGEFGNYSSFVFTDHLTDKDLVRLRDLTESDVRSRLGIPFNQSGAALRYDHSMGLSGDLPQYILRRSNETQPAHP